MDNCKVESEKRMLVYKGIREFLLTFNIAVNVN